MNLQSLLGILSAVALLAPVIIILLFRLFLNKSLWAMFIYFFFTSIYLLMFQNIIPSNVIIRNNYGLIINYADIPLMLLILSLFATSRAKSLALQIALIAFIIYELIIFFTYGLTVDSTIWIHGPGVVVVMVLCMIFFTQCAKLSIEKGKGVGKTLIISSFLFLYGCYGMIYYLYYIQKTSATADVFFIYYLVLLIASICISIGLLKINRTVRKIKEVQTTRKELAVFFGH